MKKFYNLFICTLLLIGCGGSEQAKEEFRGVAEQKDYVSLGIQYLNEGDVVRAIKSFDQAIKQDPMNSENYITLGQVYMRLKMYDRAVDTFSGAVRVDPDNGEVYYLLATSKALDGRKEGAIKDAQRSVEIFMKNREEEKFKQSLVLLRGLMEAEESDDAAAQGEAASDEAAVAQTTATE